MDWSRTKSIFIMTFLLLNLFLAFQLKEKNSANEISLITEAPTQEILSQMNVVIEEELVDEHLEGSHIVGKKRPIEEFMSKTANNQDLTELNDTTLMSVLKRPFPLDENQFQDNLKQFMSMYVSKSNHYAFGRYDQEKKAIYMMQVHDGKLMYSFDDAPLILHLDSEMSIVSYEQSLFEVDEAGEAQEFLPALKAIEVLLNEKVIVVNDTISSIDLSYYSFFKPQGNVQVFAPMWQIRINETDYLVNAIDGSIQDSE
ncbi:MAG TPA: hypothetical protein GX525_01895 [Bacilli bacterium]|nr:hypothetical protein [Bacilli bacterium]